MLLSDCIARQAEEYYFGHVLTINGIADHIPVSAEVSVNGAILQMFYSDMFTPEQRNKLFRRLLDEQTGGLSGYMKNFEVERTVRDALAIQVKERIEKRASRPYSELQAARIELARELTVHPDRSPLCT